MKHNQGILVGLSYVIGFTAAFIAFGIDDVVERQHSALIYSIGDSPVTDPAYDNFKSALKSQAATVIDFYETEIGLVAQVGDDQRIISQKNVEATEESSGTYTTVHGLAISPDGRFAHFCEKQAKSQTECVNFVYIAAKHAVAPVTFDGAQLRSDVGDLKASWQPDRNLNISPYRSTDPDQPWYIE